MITKLKFIAAIAFAVLFGGNAFAQEWKYAIEYNVYSNPEMTHQYCAYELSDGRIMVCSARCFQSGMGNGNFYPPHPAMITLSPDGEVLAENDFFKPGYWGASYYPYVFENSDGEVFALMSYSPDHDTAYFNYYSNYDNPPDDAILGLYKLDDQLEIEESHEYSYPIDNYEARYYQGWAWWCCHYSGNIFIHSAIVDEDDIVGAYTKNVSFGHQPLQGYDSLFFFRMNFEGELLANVGYQMTTSGSPWQEKLRREQLLTTDYGYIYYNPMPPYYFGFSGKNDENRAYDDGTIFYLDKEFNVLKYRAFRQLDGHELEDNYFENMAIMRSGHNTTYVATQTRTNYEQTWEDCRLYEFDDDIDGEGGNAPIIRQIERGTDEWDIVALSRAVDATDSNTLLFCYSMNTGELNNDSWIVIERLYENFETISTVYYGKDSDLLCSWAESITTTRDGGVLLTTETTNLSNPQQGWTTVTKFPAEAFEGIDEAHDNGLKVAVAYPNPGKDVLNIRTGLKDAWVEVYDVNGRLVHRQDITENVTAINTTDWSEGTYVWKVMADGKEVESGKWIKE